MADSQPIRISTAARALGWASIGIGLAETLAPQQVQRLLGISNRADHRGILQVLGTRELVHGLGILSSRNRSELTQGVWSRVAGDALDTALLAVAGGKTTRPGRFAAVAAVVLGIGILDFLCASRLGSPSRSLPSRH